jgi:hypothetical protein
MDEALPDFPIYAHSRVRAALRRCAAFPLVLAFLALCGGGHAARAEQSDDCSKCREQQRACVQNHSRAACATEYEICMKHCRRRPG